MNRQQAEHLLDAYADLYYTVNEIVSPVEMQELAPKLREVILDAMTLQTQQPTIFPITLPTTQPCTGKPIVTYMPNTGATGVD